MIGGMLYLARLSSWQLLVDVVVNNNPRPQLEEASDILALSKRRLAALPCASLPNRCDVGGGEYIPFCL